MSLDCIWLFALHSRVLRNLNESSCSSITPLADALKHTALNLLRLKGVNHVLRDDPSDSIANYAKQDPLSPQLTDALGAFVGK